MRHEIKRGTRQGQVYTWLRSGAFLTTRAGGDATYTKPALHLQYTYTKPAALLISTWYSIKIHFEQWTKEVDVRLVG